MRRDPALSSAPAAKNRIFLRHRWLIGLVASGRLRMRKSGRVGS